jgi:hypothetical protein
MDGRCENCRFWSTMGAELDMGGEPVEGRCLADGGPRSGKYTTWCSGCSGWKDDYGGKVDDPPNYGDEVREYYIQVEGPDALRASVEQSA